MTLYDLFRVIALLSKRDDGTVAWSQLRSSMARDGRVVGIGGTIDEQAAEEFLIAVRAELSLPSAPTLSLEGLVGCGDGDDNGLLLKCFAEVDSILGPSFFRWLGLGDALDRARGEVSQALVSEGGGGDRSDDLPLPRLDHPSSYPSQSHTSGPDQSDVATLAARSVWLALLQSRESEIGCVRTLTDILNGWDEDLLEASVEIEQVMAKTRAAANAVRGEETMAAAGGRSRQRQRRRQLLLHNVERSIQDEARAAESLEAAVEAGSRKLEAAHSRAALASALRDVERAVVNVDRSSPHPLLCHRALCGILPYELTAASGNALVEVSFRHFDGTRTILAWDVCPEEEEDGRRRCRTDESSPSSLDNDNTDNPMRVGMPVVRRISEVNPAARGLADKVAGLDCNISVASQFHRYLLRGLGITTTVNTSSCEEEGRSLGVVNPTPLTEGAIQQQIRSDGMLPPALFSVSHILGRAEVEAMHVLSLEGDRSCDVDVVCDGGGGVRLVVTMSLGGKNAGGGDGGRSGGVPPSTRLLLRVIFSYDALLFQDGGCTDAPCAPTSAMVDVVTGHSSGSDSDSGSEDSGGEKTSAVALRRKIRDSVQETVDSMFWGGGGRDWRRRGPCGGGFLAGSVISAVRRCIDDLDLSVCPQLSLSLPSSSSKLLLRES